MSFVRYFGSISIQFSIDGVMVIQSKLRLKWNLNVLRCFPLPPSRVYADERFVRHDFVRPIMLLSRQPSQQTAFVRMDDKVRTLPLFQKSISVNSPIDSQSQLDFLVFGTSSSYFMEEERQISERTINIGQFTCFSDFSRNFLSVLTKASRKAFAGELG